MIPWGVGEIPIGVPSGAREGLRNMAADEGVPCTDDVPSDLTADGLKAFAARCGENVARQQMREKLGIDPVDFVRNGEVDWGAASKAVLTYETGVPIDRAPLNADGSPNWHNIARAGVQVGAAAACSAYAGPYAAAPCGYVGGKLADGLIGAGVGVYEVTVRLGADVVEAAGGAASNALAWLTGNGGERVTFKADSAAGIRIAIAEWNQAQPDLLINYLRLRGYAILVIELARALADYEAAVLKQSPRRLLEVIAALEDHGGVGLPPGWLDELFYRALDPESKPYGDAFMLDGFQWQDTVNPAVLLGIAFGPEAMGNWKLDRELWVSYPADAWREMPIEIVIALTPAFASTDGRTMAPETAYRATFQDGSLIGCKEDIRTSTRFDAFRWEHPCETLRRGGQHVSWQYQVLDSDVPLPAIQGFVHVHATSLYTLAGLSPEAMGELITSYTKILARSASLFRAATLKRAADDRARAEKSLGTGTKVALGAGGVLVAAGLGWALWRVSRKEPIVPELVTKTAEHARDAAEHALAAAKKKIAQMTKGSPP